MIWFDSTEAELGFNLILEFLLEVVYAFKISHTNFEFFLTTGLYCPTGGASSRLYILYLCSREVCLSKPKWVWDFFLDWSCKGGLGCRCALLGLYLGFNRDAWLRAHLLKSPNPEGSLWSVIIMILLWIRIEGYSMVIIWHPANKITSRKHREF